MKCETTAAQKLYRDDQALLEANSLLIAILMVEYRETSPELFVSLVTISPELLAQRIASATNDTKSAGTRQILTTLITTRGSSDVMEAKSPIIQ